MARPMKIQDVEEARRWYEAGFTYQQMADMHLEKYNIEVTPTGFSSLRKREGWPGRLVIDNPLVPWDVKPEHKKAYLLAMLQREQRRREGLESTVAFPPETILAWADSLRKRGAVVDYRPDTERGFFLTYAREGIDTDLIRQPDV